MEITVITGFFTKRNMYINACHKTDVKLRETPENRSVQNSCFLFVDLRVCGC